jgi:hypothetical protein
MGDFTIDTLADALCEEYEVSKEQALDDVTAIVAKWQEAQIVD